MIYNIHRQPQFQLLTQQEEIKTILQRINRLDLLAIAAILYVVTVDDVDLDVVSSELAEVYYCRDRAPKMKTSVYLAYSVEGIEEVDRAV